MIIYNDFPQNSQGWFKRKEGKITSSRVKNVLVDKIVNKTDIVEYLVNTVKVESSIEDEKELKQKLTEYKKEVSNLSQLELESLYPISSHKFHKAQKKEYFRLLAEQLGYFDDDEDPRDRGHRLEAEAVKKLEEEIGIKTTTIGFCTRDDNEDIALSPDRLIKKGNSLSKFIGGVEVKSPGVVNHLEIIILNEIPDDYFFQIIQYFVVNDDCQYVYFISYNPIVKVKPLHIIKVNREDVEVDINQSLARQVEIIKHLKEDILSLSF